MKPIRSAPASSATSTSSCRVRPQTFTSGREISSASLSAGSGARMSAVPTRIASAPATSAAAPCARRVDAALGDHDARPRGARDELELRRAVDRERLQVARVDPDRVGAESDRAVELRRRVRLDERVHPELGRPALECRDARVVEVAQQQEDGVGTGAAQLLELLRAGEEALGEQGEAGRGAGRAEVVDRAAEALVDEDGDRGRAGALEGRGERGRLGVRPEVARRGGAALDLRDRREPGPRERVTKPAHQQPPPRAGNAGTPRPGWWSTRIPRREA